MGASNNPGVLRNCCEHDATSWGLCKQEQAGSLILQNDLFQGQHHVIEWTPNNKLSRHWEFGKLEFGTNSTNRQDIILPGAVVRIFANCNDDAFPVKVWAKLYENRSGAIDPDIYLG